MSRNEVFTNADRLSMPVPAGTVSGGPVLIGARPGIAKTDRGGGGNDADKATVWFTGAHRVPVEGAVTTVGGPVYITPTSTLTATAAGNTLWGYALATKGAGTSALEVRVART